MAIALVAGPVANKPGNGGAAWVPLSFAVGLRRLGFDVYLVEEISADACVDAAGRPATFRRSANRDFWLRVTGQFGFTGRAGLVLDHGRDHEGLGADELAAVARDAQILVNLSGHLASPSLLRGPRCRAYVDLDPGFTQHWHRSGLLGESVRDHDVHFSVGVNIGRPECSIEDDGIRWEPMLQPMVEEMAAQAAAPPTSPLRFTTVSTWRCPAGVLTINGVTFPSKLHEFRRLTSLPEASAAEFEIALDIHPADAGDRRKLLAHGWRLVDPGEVTADPGAFMAYVTGSSAEASPAQGVYVGTNSGWFSDRSVRYLAAGRPVLVQDTGFRRMVPEGEGVVAFRSLEDARRGVARITADYDAHAQAARHLAKTVFNSDAVLGRMCEQMKVPT